MATVTIRNLDPAVVEQLKRQAAANHRSLEAELRGILEQAAKRALSRTEFVALAERIAAMNPLPQDEDSDSVIHEAREERARQLTDK